MAGHQRMRNLGERCGCLEAWIILWQILCSPHEHDKGENEKEMREMNELKGFMDMGFDFSDLDRLSPRLKEVGPALKTISSSCPDRHERKQQSEVQCSNYGRSVNEDLMKDYLKKWERSVAIKVVTTF